MTPDEPMPAIRAQLQAQFESGEAMLAFGESKWSPWAGRGIEGGTIDPIVVGEASKATKTYRGGLLLASAGFGHQALMLGRSLFESALAAHWVVVESDEAVRRLNLHHGHTRLLWTETREALGWHGGPPPEVSGDDRAVFADAFGRYGERHWTGRTLHQFVHGR